MVEMYVLMYENGKRPVETVPGRRKGDKRD
jgi:hypothetical protein